METQKVENWMPVETSREAKWWYSSFHNVTAMVGAGVLGLPYALAQLGWFVCVWFTSVCRLIMSLFVVEFLYFLLKKYFFEGR